MIFNLDENKNKKKDAEFVCIFIKCTSSIFRCKIIPMSVDFEVHLHINYTHAHTPFTQITEI